MAQDPWAQFRVSSPQPVQQPQGDPIIRPADPYKAEDQQFQRNSEVRAQQDQQFQAESLRLQREAAARTATEAANRQRDRALGVDASEGERNNKAYYDRAARALEVYDKKGLGPRSMVGQAVAGAWGGESLLRNLPDAVGDSPDRQITEQAKKDFVTMILRSDSGANAPEAEVMRAIGTYFPSAGETDPTVLQNYANARLEALRGLKDKAGRLAAGMPDYAPPAEPVGATGDKAPADTSYIKDGGAYDKDGNYLGLAINMDDGPIDGGGAPPPAGSDIPISPDIRDRALRAEQIASGDQSGAQGLSTLAQQGISLGLADEAVGVGGFLSSLVRGEDPRAGYVTARDARRATVDKARNAWGGLGTAAEFAGGGGAAKIGSGVNSLLQAGKQGATLGSVAGFGSGEGAQGSTVNALIGAGGGALIGAGSQSVGNALTARAVRNAPDMAVVQAGQRQNIPVRQPDARPELRGKYAELESTAFGGPRVQSARASDAAAIEQRAKDVTGGTAFNASDNTAMGQSVQKVAERGQDNVKAAASSLYKRVEQKAGGFSTPASQTSQFIDSKIAELKAASPTGYNAEVSALEGMKADLAETGLSVRTLQAQRETVGGRIGDNIQDRSRADKTFSEVLDVAASELHSSMRSVDPQAAEMLTRADAKWGQYKRLQKEVTGLFLGKRGDATAEVAARNLDAMTRNNYSALRRFMTMATPEEKADFAATFVQNWGSNQRGDFSPALFAKNMKNVSDRTLQAIVGPKGREALRDLQVLSNAKTDAMARQAPSGKAISGAANGLKNLFLAGLGFSTGGAGAAVAAGAARPLIGALGEARTARLLLNPDFTKWLRNIPNTSNPQAINRYVGRLATIKSIASNDNQAFQQAIVQAFKASPTSAAAEDKTNGRGEPPK